MIVQFDHCLFVGLYGVGIREGAALTTRDSPQSDPKSASSVATEAN
jgi:hypothetical protein